MSHNSTTDTIKNDEFTVNPEKSEYKNLITILKEIKATIALLEKTIT